ncbi:MAG TPA: hypothetical protein VHC22_24445 [Pirellulales bacterium]|nr:hypothetical protein [Pirellulales bacterium]
MRSCSFSLRLTGGLFGVVLLSIGAAKGDAPDTSDFDRTDPPAVGGRPMHLAAEKGKRGGATSNDLKLTRPRGRDQSVDSMPPADEPDGQLLDKTERDLKLFEGFLRSEVGNGLKEARAAAGTNPEQAVQSLTVLLEKVRHASELRSEARDQLVEQIEAELRSARRQAEVQAERRLRAQQVAAEGEARERANRQEVLQEEKVDQFLSRFNALMDEKRYRDAETVASLAEEMRPGRPGLRGAELTARMTGHTADIIAVRDMRHKGLVDTTYQIELSHVPLSDEPPILYPAPEVWQLLTERRKKYKAVDLMQHSESETKILAALDEKTEVDFTEQPLTEVVDYLKERHGIEIQLDARALADLGVGSEVPVTRSIKGITLRSALKLLLGEMDLTYVIRNEVLLITSRSESENLLTTRVYPVADLVIPIPQPRMGGMGGGMGGMGGGMGMGGMTGGGMGGGMGGMGMGGMGPF